MNAPAEGFALKEKVAELSEVLLSRHPRMPMLLKEIYVALHKQPENVTLMTPEEVQIVVNGLKVQTQTEFAASATKPSATKSLAAKIGKLGADAF